MIVSISVSFIILQTRIVKNTLWITKCRNIRYGSLNIYAIYDIKHSNFLFLIRDCQQVPNILIFTYSYFNYGFPPSKAEKSNTSAKGCWESLINGMNLLAIPSSLSRSYSTFPLCSGDSLN
jgi:hypothetical protein